MIASIYRLFCIAALWTGLGLLLAACTTPQTANTASDTPTVAPAPPTTDTESSIFDNFQTVDPNVTLEVNRFIWTASLDVLSFMPIEAADPFSGLLVMGFGTPPGGSTAYRATVHISDPALDARSLNLSMATRNGPVAPDTVRTVENAILTRARQLRIAADDF